MKILILGGTRFLGRYLVDAALERGHEVTLFNRGKSNPGLYPDIETLIGDRDGGLEALQGTRTWDAVVDTCGYVPRIVGQSAELLKDRVGQYVFISSGSVYADLSHPPIDESTPLAVLEDPTTEEANGPAYGGLKALCESKINEFFKDRSLMVRSGLIVGPHDPSDRLTWWLHHIGTKEKVCLPESSGSHLQLVHGADLASWVINKVELNINGIYNVTGPESTLSMERFFNISRQILNPTTEFVILEEEFLLKNGFPDWSRFPLWIPGSVKEMAGFFQMDCSRAQRAGLKFTPLETIIKQTFAWSQTRSDEYKWRVGIDQEQEKTLLEALKNS